MSMLNDGTAIGRNPATQLATGELPPRIDFPFLDGDRLLVGLGRDVEPPVQATTQPDRLAGVQDPSPSSAGPGAFLEVVGDLRLGDAGPWLLPAQSRRAVVVIDEERFNQWVAEHEGKR